MARTWSAGVKEVPGPASPDPPGALGGLEGRVTRTRCAILAAIGLSLSSRIVRRRPTANDVSAHASEDVDQELRAAADAKPAI
jgi:hypothetical protein